MKKSLLILLSIYLIYPSIYAMEDEKADQNEAQQKFKIAIEKYASQNSLPQEAFNQIENYLKQGANINSRVGQYGETALLYSVINLNKPLFNFLLAKNADLNICDNFQRTPLYAAWLSQGLVPGKNFDIEQDFLEQGANPNIGACNNLLHAIVQLRQINPFRSMKFLITCDTIINKKNAQNDTPLKCALVLDNFEIAKELCNLGAQLNNLDSNKSNVFHVAIERGFPHNYINSLITNSRFDSYNKKADKQLKNTVKTTLLAFNRLNLNFPKEVSLTIFSYFILNSLRGFNKKLCKQLIDTKNVKNLLLIYTNNHVDQLERILQGKNKRGETALQILHKWYKNNPYIQEVECLVNGTKLQQDRIDFINGLAKEDNLVAQIHEQSKKLLLEP